MKNKKILVLAMALTLAVVMVLSGTFAWFTTNDSVINKLKTSDSPAGAEIVEVFTPPTNWKPGQEIAKEVGVVNTGEAPILTRIHFEEVLRLIKPATAEAAVFSGPVAVAAADKIPVMSNAGVYTTANGWYPVTTTASTDLDGLKLSAAVPAGMKVFAKMTTTGSVASNNLKVAYSFVTYGEITTGGYAGKKQHTNAAYDFDSDLRVLTVRGPGSDALGFMTYAGKVENIADWSLAADKPAAFANTKTSVAENKAKLAAVPGIANYIELNYDAVDSANAIAAGKWWYNTADGYFYYVGKVDAGTATANLLKSLTLNKAAGNEYANMDFDLVVKMDAIQNTKDAVIGVWGLTDGTPIVTALTAFCE